MDLKGFPYCSEFLCRYLTHLWLVLWECIGGTDCSVPPVPDML